MSVNERKRALRARLRAGRDALSQDERSVADLLITAGVMSHPAFAQADVLLSYLGFGAEVATERILRYALDLGKEVALPRCEGPHTLRWYVVRGLNDLVKSPMGMEEPDPAVCVPLRGVAQARALCLVPGLAFDRRGYRIGYGGGYFDRFLASFEGTTMGLCREVELVDDLLELGVVDKHDLPVNIVLTDVREHRR